jgi:hypothetical protein
MNRAKGISSTAVKLSAGCAAANKSRHSTDFIVRLGWNAL